MDTVQNENADIQKYFLKQQRERKFINNSRKLLWSFIILIFIIDAITVVGEIFFPYTDDEILLPFFVVCDLLAIFSFIPTVSGTICSVIHICTAVRMKKFKWHDTILPLFYLAMLPISWHYMWLAAMGV